MSLELRIPTLQKKNRIASIKTRRHSNHLIKVSFKFLTFIFLFFENVAALFERALSLSVSLTPFDCSLSKAPTCS